MKTYVINLDRRPDRLDRMTRLADERLFQFDRIAAVDARSPDFARASRMMRREGPTGILGDGTVACTMSHLKAWRTFVSNQAAGDFAVILEDDVVLSADFSELIRRLEDTALFGYGLVKLEAKGPGSRGAFVGEGVPVNAGYCLRRSYQILTNSAAYVVSRATAEILCTYEDKINAPIDHFLFYPVKTASFWGGTYGVLDPAIAVQHHDDASDIGASRYRDTKRQRGKLRFGYEARQAPAILAGYLTGRVGFRKIPFRA